MATKEKEENIDENTAEEEFIQELPLLPLDDLVVFPYMPPVPPFPPHHVALSGKMATTAVEDAMEHDRGLCIFRPKRDLSKEKIKEIKKSDLSPVGSLIHILRYKTDDEDVLFLAHGRERVQIEEILHTEPFVKARIHIIDSDDEDPVANAEIDLEVEALVRSNDEMFQRIVQMSSRYQEEYGSLTKTMIDEPGRLADYIAAMLDLKPHDKQRILEAVSVHERLNTLAVILAKELDLHELESKIQNNAQAVINKGQREYYLREQLKAIQTELGEADDLGLEIDEMREQLSETEMPDKARQAAEKELKRLAKMQSFSPESTVSRNYLDWLLNLPWCVSTEDALDIAAAQEILDADHYDLEKVKERILEYLAVCMLKDDMKGPIFCFVGPPGVGKTSLGRSIARSMNRKFVRISLGGMHDEAEIRGHRRTYIGSMPGRIVKGIRQAESNNPVFMLDEIDKLGSDFRGDPASALLEVLDPEQNHSFTDNYLDVPFDLSKVMFVTTANQLHTIPPPLRDRMETIELPGYTSNEKLMIAKQYLIPRQLAENGLKSKLITIRNTAINKVIGEYTREAGVRNLERELGTLCRKVARGVAEGNTERTTIGAKDIQGYLGPAKFDSEIASRKADVGVATGLSVTPAGGEILFIEVATTKKVNAQTQLRVTGQIGEIMQESAQAALSYVKSQSDALKFDPKLLENDIHIHVPAGAIPKDGPSAGITIATALASIATQQQVNPEVAMTGELTLRGRVLPIGGVKEKILAAKQAGIKKVIMPKGNKKHFIEVPEDIQAGLEFQFVGHVTEVFKEVFR
ncbi:MAG: endopeptidase La [Candidatus Poribacteria bacterium]|nr:endopeptidase La [Candidatus Poribacteria bacterium]